jgi:hypothetical protein
MRPAAPDLPIELRAPDGRQREITEDELVRGSLLKERKRLRAVGNTCHFVPVSREDLGQERTNFVASLDHGDSDEISRERADSM